MRNPDPQHWMHAFSEVGTGGHNNIMKLYRDLLSRKGGQGKKHVGVWCKKDGWDQCCGSGMFIPDPKFFHPGSEFFPFRIPDPHQRI
jgi:hypothetical protein